MAIQGVIHGKTIELNESPGLPDGEPVMVTIARTPAVALADAPQPPRVEDWADRLVFDSAVLGFAHGHDANRRTIKRAM